MESQGLKKIDELQYNRDRHLVFALFKKYNKEFNDLFGEQNLPMPSKLKSLIIQEKNKGFVIETCKKII